MNAGMFPGAKAKSALSPGPSHEHLPERNTDLALQRTGQRLVLSHGGLVVVMNWRTRQTQTGRWKLIEGAEEKVVFDSGLRWFKSQARR